MNIYEKKLMTLLEQDDLEVPGADAGMPPMGDEPTSDMDTAAAVDDVGANPAINYKKEQAAHMSGTIEGWISKIQDFTEFLNGLNSTSMQAQLNNAECDTMFADVSRSETKKIARPAQDLSALVESLKGYLLSSEDNHQ